MRLRPAPASRFRRRVTEKLGARHHTSLSRRFDRTDDGRRIHFASAMTFLQRDDGEPGGSYLDLADVVIRYGASAARDLEQLWRRIAFNVCVSNVDDLLRDHGFLLEPAGWTLAPAYDLNPVATGNGLTLNISETENAQDLDLVLEVAAAFRVKRARAAAGTHGARVPRRGSRISRLSCCRKRRSRRSRRSRGGPNRPSGRMAGRQRRRRMRGGEVFTVPESISPTGDERSTSDPPPRSIGASPFGINEPSDAPTAMRSAAPARVRP